MVTAPEYGGTIRPVVNLKNEGIDPYYRYSAGLWIGLVNEKLGIADWAIDRSKVSYDNSAGFLPGEALAGQLAESWENPDPLTYVFKIRDGVFWHDKAPVNGRQLTAHDVEYSFDRLLGMDGHEPSPDTAAVDLFRMSWESITATDDFTVEFKLREPSPIALGRILVAEHAFIVAREVVAGTFKTGATSQEQVPISSPMCWRVAPGPTPGSMTTGASTRNSPTTACPMRTPSST